MNERWVRGLLGMGLALMLAVVVLRPRWPEAQAASARQPGKPRAFASAIDQRNHIIAELKQLNAQTRALQQVLTSGRVKVIVVELPDDKDKGGRKR